MKNNLKQFLIVGIILIITYFLNKFYNLSNLYLESIIFIGSLFTLIKSADLFTDFSVILGNKIGLSKFATGMLIIAIGTSAPEIFSSISAALKNQAEMVIGNVFGSVISNTLLGIGIGAIASKKPLYVSKDLIRTQLSIFLCTIILGVGVLYDKAIHITEGIFLLVVLVFYLIYTFKQKEEINEKDKEDKKKENKEYSIIVLLPCLIFSLIFLFLSGDIIVDSLIKSAALLDISNTKLATTVLSIGTSLPEIMTAIVLARKNNIEGLFGEIIGSNIFDILGIFGIVPLFLTITTVNTNLIIFFSLSIFISFIAFAIMTRDKYIEKIEGFFLIFLFIQFLSILGNLKLLPYSN